MAKERSQLVGGEGILLNMFPMITAGTGGELAAYTIAGPSGAVVYSGSAMIIGKLSAHAEAEAEEWGGLPTGTSRQFVFPAAEAMTVSALRSQLDLLTKEVRELRDELARRPLVSSISLYDIGDVSVKVRLPIPVVVEETDEEALARWPEVRASGLGGTASEAIQQLKKEIRDLYKDIVSRNPKDLGPMAVETLDVLGLHLEAMT